VVTADKAGYQCLGDGYHLLNSAYPQLVAIYNNTMVNLQASWKRREQLWRWLCGIYYDPASSGGTAIATNNVWYS